jgi:hypothetical protein
MRGLEPRIHPSLQNPSKRMDCRVKPGNDAGNVRDLNQASASTINPKGRCQCTPLQGSSETMNIHSQTAISALH